MVKDLPIVDSLGREQTTTIIAEPAVTFLVSRGNTEASRRLNRWIHTEVLPQIRKTGQYRAQLTPGEALVEMANNFLRHERQIMALQEQQDETAAQVRALVNGENYFTIVGYANRIGVRVNEDQARKLGSIASTLCRQEGIERGSAPHPRYGTARTYPAEVLADVFERAPF